LKKNNIIDLCSEFSGYYKIEAIKPDGSKRLLADWFPNLITDLGLDRMGNNADWLTYCQVGSGSTEPNVDDTALVTRVAGTNTRSANTGSIQSSSPYYVAQTNTYRFAAGVATGTLAEVGIGWASTGSLYSRALILDSGGSPTTITVLSDETLDVTYQVRQYIPETDTEGEILLRETTHAWVGRAARCTTLSGGSLGWNIGSNGTSAAYFPSTLYDVMYDGSIGAKTTTPAGSSDSFNTGTHTVASYSAGTHYSTHTLTAPIGIGNFAAGIGAILVKMGIGYYQFGFTPHIMKTNVDSFSMTFRHSWARKTI
jgi:hypothetical protein